MTTPSVAASRKKPDGRGRHPQTNPNSLANLIKHQYQPGQNGNPKPGNSLKAALLNALGEPLSEPGPDATARERIIYATLKGAIDCEPTSAHLKEVWDRAEGKVPGDVVAAQLLNQNIQINIISNIPRPQYPTEGV